MLQTLTVAVEAVVELARRRVPIVSLTVRPSALAVFVPSSDDVAQAARVLGLRGEFLDSDDTPLRFGVREGITVTIGRQTPTLPADFPEPSGG